MRPAMLFNLPVIASGGLEPRWERGRARHCVTGLPTSVAAGPDGSVYVDINGDSSTPGSGEVLKITGLG